MRTKWTTFSILALFALALLIFFGQGAGQAQTPLADLDVYKSADQSSIAPGELVFYSVVLSNNTPVTMELDSLVDTLPDGFKYMGLAPDSEWGVEAWDTSPPDIQWSGPITVPMSGTLTFRYKIYVPDSVPLSPVRYTNTVVVSDTYMAEAGVLVGVGEASVNKDAAPREVEPGDMVTYTITFSNSGYVPLPLAQVMDVLPDGVTLDGMTANSDVQDMPAGGVTGPITWTGPFTIPSHALFVVEYQAEMPAIVDTAYLTNRAWGQLDDGTETNQDAVEVRVSSTRPTTISLPLIMNRWAPAAFLASKTADPKTALAEEPGELIEYTVEFENIGTVPGMLGEIRDTLPNGFTFVQMLPGSDVSTPPAGTTGEIVWNGPFAVPGESSLTLVYQVRAGTDPGIYVNSVEATVTDGKPPEGPATATVELVEPVMLTEDWESPSPDWMAFTDYWRLNPYQWYLELGAGVGGSTALRHTYYLGVPDPDDGAHDALYLYQNAEATKWTDYRYEARVKFDEGTTQGLWVRAKYIDDGVKNNGRQVMGYYVVWRAKGDFVRLSYINDEGKWAYHFADPIELITVPYVIDKGTWYTVAVEVDGTNIRVYVDGNKVIDYVDAHYSEGSVGFFAYQGIALAWDNIVVSPLH